MDLGAAELLVSNDTGVLLKRLTGPTTNTGTLILVSVRLTSMSRVSKESRPKATRRLISAPSGNSSPAYTSA